MDLTADPIPSNVAPKSWPWLTVLVVAVCILDFAGITAEAEKKGLSAEVLAKWGWAPAPEVWNGAYWSLLTSVFVHAQLWHLGFNCYWLMVFGTLLERRLGRFWYLLFFVSAGFVSSSFQLGIGGDTGIGASGVVYAMFGALMLLGSQWPEAKEFVTNRIVVLFIAWLVGCYYLNHTQVIQVGNAAHLMGMTFGLAVGGWIFHSKRGPCKYLILGHLAIAALFLIWCPWSIPWLMTKAYNLHNSKRYADAIQVYTRIIDMNSDNSWAYHNRASAYQSLGRDLQAESDLGKAKKLDARPAK